MKDINLLAALTLEQRAFNLKTSTRNALALLVLLVLLIAAGHYAIGYIDLQYQQEIADMRTEMRSYQAVQEAKAAINATTAGITGIQDIVTTTDAASHVGTSLLTEIQGTLSENIYLTNMTISENGSVSLVGKAANRPDITFFIYALKLTEIFNDVHLSVVYQEFQEGLDNSSYGFTVSATLKEVEADG